ncbi:MAG: pantoate--beta-alanine ligase [Chloroflexota bacterium]|nr:pantoate--beta-alanine ligase [Chloroflexota bacterium]
MAARRELSRPFGFVPTMGALHAGHASLLAAARADCPSVVASIFVNPRQFGPSEDFQTYPRDEAADLAFLERAGVDVAFVPPVEEIYPPGSSTYVDVGRLGEVLEGAQRRGHFRGVATVVSILFALVAPDRAYFGQKDGQQVVVVRRLVDDLGFPIEIVVGPTVREPDGLALSSRNRYLAPPQRTAASIVHACLVAVHHAYRGGERSGDGLRRLMLSVLGREPLVTPDYVSVADAATLEELEVVDRPALVSLAVHTGSTRLIDCLPLHDPVLAGLRGA